jgi:signal peptidase I
MDFFRRRRIRKRALGVLHHARHVRHMREDVAAPDLVGRLRASEQKLQDALKSRDPEAIEAASEQAIADAQKLVISRPMPGTRENLEIVLVALVVAMAIRTYFLQPFKIPTGSMQPTLYGIHYEPRERRGLMEGFPLSVVSRVLFGRAYVEIRANASGTILRDPRAPEGGPAEDYYVGVWRHSIPRGLRLRFSPGERVVAGQLLATGVQIGGDHIFVDKVRWNFVRPKRGEVMVFFTTGITNIQQNTHYIKRLVGLPGEELSIVPPCILINGKRLTAPPSVMRVQNSEPGYAGYQVTHRDGTVLRDPGDRVRLTLAQYMGLGDNTLNSLDSRYWGPVPQKNLVGPALLTYWPFSATWGFLR